jgi:hypothetical protein
MILLKNDSLLIPWKTLGKFSFNEKINHDFIYPQVIFNIIIKINSIKYINNTIKKVTASAPYFRQSPSTKDLSDPEIAVFSVKIILHKNIGFN